MASQVEELHSLSVSSQHGLESGLQADRGQLRYAKPGRSPSFRPRSACRSAMFIAPTTAPRHSDEISEATTLQPLAMAQHGGDRGFHELADHVFEGLETLEKH